MSKLDIVPAFNFHFLTPFYDILTELFGYRKEQREKVLTLLDLKQSETLLDVGCGTGALLIQAKKQHPKVIMTGIDVDPTVLTIARRKIKKENLDITLIETSADTLPFKTGQFDCVVSTLVFHHLPRHIKKGALKEIYRVLKNDGRFLFVDFGKTDTFWTKCIFSLEECIHLAEAKTAKDNADGMMPQFLKEAGFQIQTVGKKYRGIEYLMAKKTNLISSLS